MKLAAWLVAVAVATLAVVAVATRAGTGVSTDSVAYIAEARSLRAGDGFALPAGVLEIYDHVDFHRDALPSAHFPPLYPTVLAATGLAGDGSSVRWLNALLLAATAAVVAAMVFRYTASCRASAVAVTLVVLAPAVLRVHAMAWSEPLFIAVGLAGLLALAAFVEQPRLWLLGLGAAGTGGAWLTRHIGIAFVVAGLAVLLRYRRRHAVTFLAMAGAPMSAFLLFMARAGGGDGYTITLRRPSPAAFDEAFAALGNWFDPAPVVVIALAGVGAYLLLRRVRLAPAPGPAGHLEQLPLLLGLALLGYAAVVAASLFVFGEYVPLEERILVPAYVLAVALVTCVLSRRRTVLDPVVAAVVALTFIAGAGHIRAGTRPYPGFAAPEWVQSKAITVVEGLPATTRVYSNFPEAIYLRTGRVARLLPPPAPGMATARLVEDVRSGHGVVVLFTHASRSWVDGPAALTTALGFPRPTLVGDVLVYGRMPTTPLG